MKAIRLEKSRRTVAAAACRPFEPPPTAARKTGGPGCSIPARVSPVRRHSVSVCRRDGRSPPRTPAVPRISTRRCRPTTVRADFHIIDNELSNGLEILGSATSDELQIVACVTRLPDLEPVALTRVPVWPSHAHASIAVGSQHGAPIPRPSRPAWAFRTQRTSAAIPPARSGVAGAPSATVLSDASLTGASTVIGCRFGRPRLNAQRKRFEAF